MEVHMRTVLLLAALGITGGIACGTVLAQTSPYAGQQTREIKALSAQEIDDLP
jgi:hypothetical protein